MTADKSNPNSIELVINAQIEKVRSLRNFIGANQFYMTKVARDLMNQSLVESETELLMLLGFQANMATYMGGMANAIPGAPKQQRSAQSLTLTLPGMNSLTGFNREDTREIEAVG